MPVTSETAQARVHFIVTYPPKSAHSEANRICVRFRGDWQQVTKPGEPIVTYAPERGVWPLRHIHSVSEEIYHLFNYRSESAPYRSTEYHLYHDFHELHIKVEKVQLCWVQFSVLREWGKVLPEPFVITVNNQGEDLELLMNYSNIDIDIATLTKETSSA